MDESKEIGTNITFKKIGSKAVLEIDLDKTFGRSKSGKSGDSREHQRQYHDPWNKHQAWLERLQIRALGPIRARLNLAGGRRALSKRENSNAKASQR